MISFYIDTFFKCIDSFEGRLQSKLEPIKPQIKELSDNNMDPIKYHECIWSSENVEEYTKKFEEFEVYKEVKSMHNLVRAFEYKMFNRLRTSEKINKKWDYISSLLKQA